MSRFGVTRDSIDVELRLVGRETQTVGAAQVAGDNACLTHFSINSVDVLRQFGSRRVSLVIAGDPKGGDSRSDGLGCFFIMPAASRSIIRHVSRFGGTCNGVWDPTKVETFGALRLEKC